MSRRIVGRVVLVLSGLRFPLTQLAIRRFGARGALLVEAVSGGLLIRDAAMLAAGTLSRLRRGPAILLWLEAATAAAATLTSLRPLLAATTRGTRHPATARLEAVRRAAVGMPSGCTRSASGSGCSPITACGKRAERQRRIR